MVALILAGGFGTRINHLFPDLPKPLIEVDGKPFLQHQIELLSYFGIRDIVLSTGYLGEKIKDYFQDGSQFGVRINYSQESEPLGTGGAIKLASSLIKENFFLWNGDDMPILNWKGLLKFVNENKERNIMTIHRGGHGNIEIEERSNKVTAYFLKAGQAGLEWSHAGLVFLNKSILENLPEGKFDFEETFFRELAKGRELLYFKADDITLSIGTPGRLRKIRKELPDYLKKVYARI